MKLAAGSVDGNFFLESNMVYHKILGCVGKKPVDIKEAGAGKKQVRVLLSESMCFVGKLKIKNK